MSTIKSTTQPHCRWCAKPLRKWTKYVYVKERAHDTDKAPLNDGWCSYHYTGAGPKPKTLVDCKPLSNLPVISISRGPDGYVSRFNTWDGETYESVGGLFCSNTCAINLGISAASQHNLVGKAYNDRLAKLRAPVVAEANPMPVSVKG